MVKPPIRKPKKKSNPLAQAKIEYVDYKDTALLRKFISDRGKIRARRVTGVSVQEQRQIAKAIKNAREMALLPYASRVTSQRTSRGERGDRGRADGPPPRPSGPPPNGDELGEDFTEELTDETAEFGDDADTEEVDA